MNVVHLTASTFHGGPERQMLGLAEHLPREYQTRFFSFSEAGRSRAFIGASRRAGFEAATLKHDTPYFSGAIGEIVDCLTDADADVLLCHGYKANLLGNCAARRVGIPVVAVSRGWTGESARIRFYEWLDRLWLRRMDRVIGVSEAQAERVRRSGVSDDGVRVIHNAVDPDRFLDTDPHYRTKLMKYFATPKTHIIGAAGRLSPEKGFTVLVQAAERVVRDNPSVGFVLFGEGAERGELLRQIHAAGLTGSFVVARFRQDLDRFLPFFDILALPSFTEGLPNIVLEACAAGVPVVATIAGGTVEVIEDGSNGYLVPPADADALASRLLDLLAHEDRRHDMGLVGRQRVVEQFSFAVQADHYCDLFEELCGSAQSTDVGQDGEAASFDCPELSVSDFLATGEPCQR